MVQRQKCEAAHKNRQFSAIYDHTETRSSILFSKIFDTEYFHNSSISGNDYLWIKRSWDFLTVFHPMCKSLTWNNEKSSPDVHVFLHYLYLHHLIVYIYFFFILNTRIIYWRFGEWNKSGKIICCKNLQFDAFTWIFGMLKSRFLAYISWNWCWNDSIE